MTDPPSLGESSTINLADGLVAVLLAFCFPLSPVQTQQERARSRLDWNRIGDEAITILSNYLRINTANPPGNEIEAAEFFSRIFDSGNPVSNILVPARSCHSLRVRCAAKFDSAMITNGLWDSHMARNVKYSSGG